MNLADIPSVPGARHRKKRLGRGIGSGHGKTATRGQKGQRSRSGSGKRPGFEGGRTPLIRALPKRGFRQKATGRPLPPQIVNVGQLDRRCQDQEAVTPERLRALGLIQDADRAVKLLGDGTLAKRLTVAIHRASGSARAKVLKAGGSLELIGSGAGPHEPGVDAPRSTQRVAPPDSPDRRGERA